MNRNFLFWVMGLCLLLPVMISTQSFWIDECGTARFACAPSWSVWVQLMRTDLSSDSQMPLFMFLARCWSLIAGRSEFLLRTVNIFFGVICIVSAWFVGKRLKVNSYLLSGLVCCQPFFWVYMDEFRPYVMQMAAGWMIVLAVINVMKTERPEANALLFWTGGLLMAGSSMLGAIPLFLGVVAWICMLWLRKEKPSRGFFATSLVGFILVLGLGGYYLLKLLAGGGGSKSWSPGMGNVLFSIYELAGAVGLGPDRNVLRMAVKGGGLLAVVKSFIPWLGLLAVGYVFLLISWVFSGLKRRKEIFLFVGALVAGFASLLMLSSIFQWPFWGRHLAPFQPCLVILLALLISSGGSRWSRGRGVIGGSLLVMLLISSAGFRYSGRFLKDDYRGAYQRVLPLIEQGRHVWWAANTESAFYYKLVNSPQDSLPANFHPVLNVTSERLETVPRPELIVLSKHDLYDANGAIRAYLKDNGCENFEVLSGHALWR